MFLKKLMLQIGAVRMGMEWRAEASEKYLGLMEIKTLSGD